MEVTFSTTEADSLAFNLFRAQSDPSLKKRIVRARIMMTVSFALVGLGFWFLTNSLFLLIWFLVLSALSCLFYNRYHAWRVKRRIKEMYRDPRYRDALSPHTLRATPEGLVDSSALGEMKVDWAKVDGLFETPTHVFISVGQVLSVPIPRHASTPSPEELAAFISACQSFMQGAA
jgi:hypothetical protein